MSNATVLFLRLATAFAVFIAAELVLLMMGGLVGILVYIPGPIDGWFFFRITAFSALFACLGFPLAVIVAGRAFLKTKPN